MDNCPVCLKIKNGEMITAGDHCCTIQWGDRKVAVLSRHAEVATADETAEALDLLEFDAGKLNLASFEGAVGHWGLESIPSRVDGSSSHREPSAS